VIGWKFTAVAVVVSPLPERFTCWVEPATFSALSVNVSVPMRLPPVVGENTTPTTQESPTASGEEVEQVVVLPSTLKLVLAVMPLRFSGALPMLASVNVCAALLELIWVGGKLRGGVATDTDRMRWLYESAMYRLPAESTATPRSALNSALVAGPSSPL